jgi:hypothetical protein
MALRFTTAMIDAAPRSADQMTVAARHPRAGDPILRAMGTRAETHGRGLAGSAWVIIAVVVVFNAADVLLRPALFVGGTPWLPLSDWKAQQMLAWSLLAVPAVMYLYVWLPGSMAKLIPELVERGVIAGPKPGIDEPLGAFAERALERYDRQRWVVPAVLLILWYALVKFLALPSAASDAVRGQWLLDSIASAAVIYAATLTFFRMIDSIRVTNELFSRYELRVYPYHPDGAGGLSPVGRRITNLARVGAVASVATVFMNLLAFQNGNDLLRSPETVFAVGSLLVIAPLIMWAWLREPHQAMLAARGEVLGEVCSIYDRVARQPLAPGGDDAAITASVTAGTDLLEQLDRRAKEVTATYPTWPVHTTELRTVSATVSAPLVAGIVGIVIKLIQQQLGAG